MKIGILTFHYALNQGAVLQAYALQTYLERQGHKVEFIDYRPMRRYTWRNFFSKSLSNSLFKIMNVYYGEKYSKNGIFSKVLNYGSVRYASFEELKMYPPIYDLYIVGSDQVWHFPHSIDLVYLMAWVPDGAHIVSYAASFGQHMPPKDNIQKFAYYLCRFNKISVRESSGVEYANSLLNNKKAIQSIDPTLLLTISDYNKIEERCNVGYDFFSCYILTKMETPHYEIIERVQLYLKCRLINLRNPDTCVFLKGYTNIIVTPYQWLYYIKNSKAVICSSFHAVVFSIIFHKPFIVLITEDMQTNGGNLRVKSLLEPLGLLHHCVHSANELALQQLLSEKINWINIDAKISRIADEAKQYLNQCTSL